VQHIPLDEIADIGKARWLAVLRVYLDESQPRGSRFFALGGCVFAPQDCPDFEERWSLALASYKPPLKRFHMTDWENGWGEFRGWSDEKRHDLFRRLAHIIRRTVRFHICSVVDLDAWESLPAEDRATFRDHKPYSLAFAYIFRNIAARTGDPGPIAYIFDQGPGGRGRERIEGEYRYLKKRAGRAPWFRLSTFTSAGSTETLELQAADVVVYEMAKYAPRLFARPYRDRTSRALLFDQVGAPPAHYHKVSALEIKKQLAFIRSDPEGLIETTPSRGRKPRERVEE
jgi:hypothetical protein